MLLATISPAAISCGLGVKLPVAFTDKHQRANTGRYMARTVFQEWTATVPVQYGRQFKLDESHDTVNMQADRLPQPAPPTLFLGGGSVIFRFVHPDEQRNTTRRRFGQPGDSIPSVNATMPAMRITITKGSVTDFDSRGNTFSWHERTVNRISLAGLPPG